MGCQNQDSQDWRDFQDFDFARIALFAVTRNPAELNTNKRLPNKMAALNAIIPISGAILGR